LLRRFVLTAAIALLAPVAVLAGDAGLDAMLPGDAAVTAPAVPADVVVLVHGLGRTRISMLLLERTLERQGYSVINWGYSSTCCSISELASELADDLDELPEAREARIHFVGHSLGSIIVRTLLASEPPQRVGRVVMLAPPNQGSTLADRYASRFGWLLRPLPELTTDQKSISRRLPPVTDFEVGVIAGRDDGKVSIEESHLPGEADHVVVPSAHTFIMLRSDVHRLVLNFLREGRFSPESRSADGARTQST
jgi:triacylglycerol lipase